MVDSEVLLVLFVNTNHYGVIETNTQQTGDTTEYLVLWFKNGIYDRIR